METTKITLTKAVAFEQAHTFFKNIKATYASGKQRILGHLVSYDGKCFCPLGASMLPVCGMQGVLDMEESNYNPIRREFPFLLLRVARPKTQYSDELMDIVWKTNDRNNDLEKSITEVVDEIERDVYAGITSAFAELDTIQV